MCFQWFYSPSAFPGPHFLLMSSKLPPRLRRAVVEAAGSAVGAGKRALKRASTLPRSHELEVVLSNAMCKASVRPYRPKQVSSGRSHHQHTLVGIVHAPLLPSTSARVGFP
jgi:hypothetical protein